MRCQLCGYEFEAAHLSCHPSCPLGSRCHLICCPNCGYQVVDESKSRFAQWLRRWWRSGGAADDGPSAGDSAPVARYLGANRYPLSHVEEGGEVEVESLDDMPDGRMARLSTFGLVPGSHIRMVQRHPVPVVAVGETELSLSREILDQIWVQTKRPV